MILKLMNNEIFLVISKFFKQENIFKNKKLFSI